MKYTIRRESDINEGVLLYAEIPSDQVDWDALYTIEADMPDFIVPFTYRIVDDAVECCYKVGNRSLLRFFPGEKNTAEYCDLFMQLLSPLKNCGNWFMQPLSFVLEYDQIHFDPATQRISYLYIPSKELYSDENDLYEMTKRLCREFPVKNSELQIKVLSALVDNFSLRSFLQIIKDASNVQQNVSEPFKAVNEPSAVKMEFAPKIEYTFPMEFASKVELPPSEEPIGTKSQIPIFTEPEALPVSAPIDVDDGLDIFFNFEQAPQDKKSKVRKEKKEKKVKPDRKAKSEKVSEERKGNLLHEIFAKKEKGKNKNVDEQVNKAEQIIIGASAEVTAPFNNYSAPEIPPASYQPESPVAPYNSENEHTIIQKRFSESVPRLVNAGDKNLPEVIEIHATAEKIFKIGRYDVSLKRKQSDFEFPSKTKEVSRHHAVIEVKEGEYYITDIGSLAGTYIDGERLHVSVPYQLRPGTRVSFGNAGADYIFRK